MPFDTEVDTPKKDPTDSAEECTILTENTPFIRADGSVFHVGEWIKDVQTGRIPSTESEQKMAEALQIEICRQPNGKNHPISPILPPSFFAKKRALPPTRAPHRSVLDRLGKCPQKAPSVVGSVPKAPKRRPSRWTPPELTISQAINQGDQAAIKQLLQAGQRPTPRDEETIAKNPTLCEFYFSGEIQKLISPKTPPSNGTTTPFQMKLAGRKRLGQTHDIFEAHEATT